MMRSWPISFRSRRVRSISTATSVRFSSSAALVLKNRTSRPSAWISATTRWALGRVDLRSRCTPKIWQPARARARLVAAPNPEDAPRIRAQPESLIGDASAFMAVSLATARDPFTRLILAGWGATRRLLFPLRGRWKSVLPCAASMARTAGIILIGNEILSGKVVDANASYLCRELRTLGVEVRKISVIPDEVELIAFEVSEHSRAFDVVFTSGGVGPTHDDVTIEGVARAMGVPVVRHPRLVATLEGYYRGELNDAHLKMAETPEGAELVGGEPVRFPTILMRNVYVLPGVPEIFRAKFEALRERFRDAPIHLKNVFVSIGEGELADYLNGLLADFPLLLLGSYPEFSNPEYRVKVTLESRDPGYLEKALAELLRRLPVRAVVQVT